MRMHIHAGAGTAPGGKWRFHLPDLKYYIPITHGGVVWFDSKLRHCTRGPRSAPARDKRVIGECAC